MRIVIPSSIADASKEKVFLAGGTQIMRNKGESDVLPDVVADISAVVPSEISKEGEDIIIGAMATFNDLIESSLVPSYLKESAACMASWELRNIATIGGNIASELDSSYLLPSLIASDAELLVWDKGEKRIKLVDYLASDDEFLIISVIVRNMEVQQKCYRRASHMHSVINYARAVNEAVAVKNEGIFINEDDIAFSDDEYGSAEYKRYLVNLERQKGGEE